MNLEIFGESDDLFELRGLIREEIDCYHSTCAVEITVYGRGLRVTMEAGYWKAKVEPINEPDVDWILNYTVERPMGRNYSERVHVEVPDNALIRVLVDEEILIDSRVGKKALEGWERKAVNAGWLPVNTNGEGSVKRE